MKYEQTIQSLAELVAEQWEMIQQKRNYIEYLESEQIEKLEAEVSRLEGELLTQRGLQGETQRKLFEEQELRRCENELRIEKKVNQ